MEYKFCLRVSKRNISKAATGGFLKERVFLKVLQSLKKNTCARVSFHKVVGLDLKKSFRNYLKKRLQRRCVPVKFAKFLIALF